MVDVLPTLALRSVEIGSSMAWIKPTFLLGRQKKSDREGFPVYNGDEMFAYKWRNWNMHFIELNSIDLDEKSFKKWVKELGGNRKTFTCEGILMELESGDHYAVQSFLLSEEDLAFLKPGYEKGGGKRRQRSTRS